MKQSIQCTCMSLNKANYDIFMEKIVVLDYFFITKITNKIDSVT